MLCENMWLQGAVSTDKTHKDRQSV